MSTSGQVVKLVEDIRTLENPENGSYPASFLRAGNRFFFTAYTKETGRDLWVSDGTKAGTRMVKDKEGGYLIRLHTYMDSILYFSASDFTNGNELWRSDGTDTGTYLVKDINPGIAGSNPDNLVQLDGNIYFTTRLGPRFYQLWVSDGTANGTKKIPLSKYYECAAVQDMVAYKGRLFFRAYHAAFRTWVIYALNPVTNQLSLIDLPLSTTNEHNGMGTFKIIGDHLFTTTRTRPFGATRLWRIHLKTDRISEIDLTGAAAQDLSEIDVSSFFLIDSTQYFTGIGDAHNTQLWKLALDSTQPQQVRSLGRAAGESKARSFLAYNGKLFFINVDSTLWVSDGSYEGTKSIIPFTSAGAPALANPSLQLLHNKLVFFGYDPVHKYVLWQSDGTPKGTQIIASVLPETYAFQRDFVSLDTAIYFAGYHPVYGNELWTSNGSTIGTKPVLNIAYSHGSSSPKDLVFANNKLFFTALGDTWGRQLYKSDNATNDATLFLNHQINPDESLSPKFLSKLADKMLFVTAPFQNEADVWQTNGVESETYPLTQLNRAYESFTQVFNTKSMVFMVVKNKNNDFELWASKGTKQNTQLVFTSNYDLTASKFTETHSTVLFEHGGNLIETDGTKAGTRTIQLRDITCNIWHGTDIATANNYTYFSAYDVKGNTGGELWCRDNNTGKVRLVKDINPGKQGTHLSHFQPFGLYLLFQVKIEDQIELWITTGATSSTRKLKTLLDNSRLGYAQMGNKMIFKTRNHFDIDNLYITDGSIDSTKILTDYLWLNGASTINDMTTINDRVYFSLTNEQYGKELWYYDAFDGSTNMVSDLMPGPASSNPMELTPGNNTLYFTADHPDYGREVFFTEVPSSKIPKSTGEETIKLFPNPAQLWLNVSFSQHIPGEYHSVSIYNVWGKLITKTSSRLNPMRINTNLLIPGVYIVKTESGLTAKFIKY